MLLKQKSIITNGLYSITAKVISLIVPLLVLPFILRTLGVVAYGKVSYALSLVSYFTLFATLGISNYSQREIARIKKNSALIQTKASHILTVSIVTTVISLVLFYAYMIFDEDARKDYLLYVVSSIMIISSGLMMDWLYVSLERFDLVSIRTIIGRLCYLIFCFALIRTSDDYILYVAVLVFAQYVIPLFINHLGIWTGKLGFVPCAGLSKDFCREFMSIFYLGLMTLGSKLFSSSDVIITKWASTGSGAEAVGFFSTGIMIPFVAESLLFVLVSVATPRLYYYIGVGDEKMSLKLSNQLSNAMYFIVVPIVLTCIFFSNEIIELFAGASYLPAAGVLQIYSIILLTAVGITIAGTRTYVARKKEKKLFCILIIMAFFNIGLDILFIKLWGIRGVAMATVFSNVLLLIIEMSLEKTWSFVFTKDKFNYIWGGISLAVIFCAFRYFSEHISILSLLACVCTALLLYVGIMSLLKESTIILTQRYIKSYL